MNDPRLNSVHLEFPRREDFRRARDVLLDARGQNTLVAEMSPSVLANAAANRTIISEAAEEAPANSDHWLLDQGHVYPLKTGVNTIGRLPDNDVVLEGAYVSRRHCAILVHSGATCELYDIASKNGTFVNGLKLKGSLPLTPGDEIRMCDRSVVFMSKFGKPRDPQHDQTQSA